MANIPTSVEVGAANGVENYSYNKEKNRIDGLFEYIAKDSSNSEISKSEMHATIKVLVFIYFFHVWIALIIYY
jgi:hypothetical protein